MQIPYNSMDMALYGIALVLIYTVVLDRLILSGTSKTEVKVVSLKADEIRRPSRRDCGPITASPL